MPSYHFHLENSMEPSGDASAHEFASDEDAIAEAGRAVAEVLSTEFYEGRTAPHAIVTIDRDGVRIASVKAQGVIERTG